MITLKPLLSLMLILLFSALFLPRGSQPPISMAQDDLTITPETTHPAVDADLYEEFEASLYPETAPRLSPEQSCELPCWWGMTPGVTSEEDVIRILESTSFFRNWNQSEPFVSNDGAISGSISLDLLPEVYWEYYILFSANQGKLDYIQMRIVEPNKWFPTDMFDLVNILHISDEVPIIHVFYPGRSFHLIFEYSGILLNYDYHYLDDNTRYTLTEERRVKSLNICSQDDILYEINVTLFDPSDQEFLNEQLYNHEYFVPIHEKTDINTQTFINFFQDNPDECLEITLIESEA